MTDEFDPTSVHESLDHAGLLDDAHGKGVYAIALDVPDSVEEAHRQWLEHFETSPGDDAIARLVGADQVAYVGASSDVYSRIMDHAEGDVRKASVLEAFPPVEVVEVWPHPSPFDYERERAYMLAGGGTVVWVNGEVIC